MRYFYTVRIQLEFKSQENENPFFNTNECFVNENPYLARKDAFHYFYSCLDIILGVENSNELTYEKIKTLLSKKTEDIVIIGVLFYCDENEGPLSDYDEDFDVYGSLIYNLNELNIEEVDRLLWVLTIELDFYKEIDIKNCINDIIIVEFNTLDSDESDEIIEHEILNVDFPFSNYISLIKYPSEEDDLIKEIFELKSTNINWNNEEKQCFHIYKNFKIDSCLFFFDTPTEIEINEGLAKSKTVKFLKKIGLSISKIEDIPTYLELIENKKIQRFFILNKEERNLRKSLNVDFNPINWSEEDFQKYIQVINFPQEHLPNINILEINEELIRLIKNGESMIVEFKPSMVSSFDQVNKIAIRSIDAYNSILKTICAFLNTQGGYLFIGINDKMFFNNLENDSAVLNQNNQNKRKEDLILLELDFLIKENFKSNISEIKPILLRHLGKKFIVVKIYPSRHPVFVKFNNSNEKLFFVRTAASSIHLHDIEEVGKYCISHWSKIQF